jgi:hypothetical protein
MVTQTDELGKKAALLSIVEIGLGSVLHGLKIPLSGHFLSLNQVFILSWASRVISARSTPGIISNTAALLKSLSPAGKKLTPMLAIAMQGQLFSLGLILLGLGRAGHILGAFFSILWGFIQPALLYAILYGAVLLDVSGFLVGQLQQVFPVTTNTLLTFLLVLILVKFILGICCVLLAHRLTEKQVEAYVAWASKQKPAQRKGVSTPWLGALKDLFSPLFIVSWLLTVLFIVFAQHSEAPSIWVWLRPLALGYLLFLALRLVPLEWVQNRLGARSPKLAQVLKSALEIVRR